MTKLFLSNGFIPVYLLVMFTLVTPVNVQGQNQTQIEEWTTYEDPILGISIQHPSEWEPIEDPNALAFEVYENETSPLLFTDIVLVTPSVLGVNSSAEFMNTILNALRGETSDIYEIDNEARIKGIIEPISKAVFTTKNEDGKVIGRSVTFTIVSDDDKAYKIAFITKPTGYEKFIPTIQKMIDSFKIL